MVTIGSGIRGITDRKPRAPRVGKIRLGVVTTTASGVERPQATDHFVVPEEVAAVYGDKPTSLDIMFISNDRDVTAAYNLKQYGAGSGLKCRGDGVNAQGLVHVPTYEKWAKSVGFAENEPQPAEPPPIAVWDGGGKNPTREWKPLPCFGMGYDEQPPCPAFESKACRTLMHLQFVMPRVPALGVWQMDTGSPISIKNILNFLDFLEAFTGGNISGIPLRLELVPIEVAPDGKKRTVHVVEIRSDATMDQISKPTTGALISQMEIPPPAEAERNLLPAPEEDEDEIFDAFEGGLIDTDTGEIVAPDDETPRAYDPRIVIPEDIGDLPTLLRWAHSTYELQPSEVWELLEVENGRALLEQFGSYRDAAKQIIAVSQQRAVADRMFADAPPMPSDGAGGRPVPNVPED